MEQCSDIKTFTPKETEMLLYLKEMIRRSGGDDLQFFQSAYIFVFDKFYECVSDVVQYRLHGIVPKYVQTYLEHIKYANS